MCGKVINTPAEAALAPPGDTYTITGTSLAVILLTIDLMEVSSPPGVSSSMTRASAFSFSASSILL